MSVDHRSRRDALRTLLVERELDAILVTDLLNIRYLTGFTGSNAALVVSARDADGDEDATVICTDGRYVTQVAEQVPDLRAEIDRSSAAHLIGTFSGDVLAFEAHVATFAEHRSWTES